MQKASQYAYKRYQRSQCASPADVRMATLRLESQCSLFGFYYSWNEMPMFRLLLASPCSQPAPASQKWSRKTSTPLRHLSQWLTPMATTLGIPGMRYVSLWIAFSQLGWLLASFIHCWSNLVSSVFLEVKPHCASCIWKSPSLGLWKVGVSSGAPAYSEHPCTSSQCPPWSVLLLLQLSFRISATFFCFVLFFSPYGPLGSLGAPIINV